MRRPVYKAPSQRDAATGKDSDMPRFLPSGPNAGNFDQDRVVTVLFKGAICIMKFRHDSAKILTMTRED